MKFSLKIFSLILAIALGSVSAFKVSTHVAVANKALDDIQKSFDESSGTNRVTFHGIDLDVSYDRAYNAILQYPEYFRMGTTGPDAFPDMVGGQAILHTNNGVLNEDFPTKTSTKYEHRYRPSTYRSIDFAMKLLDMAYERGDDKELSFALGFVGHCVGDGFMHTWINEQVEGSFDYFHGDGFLGGLTEEVKHVAVEGFIDARLPHVLTSTNSVRPSGKSDYNRMDLNAPYDLLDEFFNTYMNEGYSESIDQIYESIVSGELVIEGDNMAGHPDFPGYTRWVAEKIYNERRDLSRMNGEFVGGKLYEYFDFQLNILESIENGTSSFRQSLSNLGEMRPFSYKAMEYVLDKSGFGWAKSAIDDIMAKFNANESQFNYLSEIDDNYDDMKEKIKAYRRNWMVMSKCVMENAVKGHAEGNVDNCLEVNNDTHLNYMNVDGSDLVLFKEEIQKLFEMHEGEDFHKLSDNAQRAIRYLLSSFKLDDFEEVLMPSQIGAGWIQFRNWLRENKDELNLILKVPAADIAALQCTAENGVCAAKCFTNNCAEMISDCHSGNNKFCDIYSGCGLLSNKRACVWGLCSPSLRDVCHVSNPGYGVCKFGMSGTDCIEAIGDQGVDCVSCSANCVWDEITCKAKVVENVFTMNSVDQIDEAIDGITDAIDSITATIKNQLTELACGAAESFGAPLEDLHRVVGIYKSLEELAANSEYGSVNFAYLQEDLQDQNWYNRLVAENSNSSFVAFLNDIKNGNATSLYDKINGESSVEVPDNCLDFSSQENNGLTNDPNFQFLVSSSIFTGEPGPTAKKIVEHAGKDVPYDFVPFYNSVQGHKLLPLNSKIDIENWFDKAGVRKDFLPWNLTEHYSSICYENSSEINIYCDVIASLDDPSCYECKVKNDPEPYPLTQDWLSGNFEMEIISANGQTVNWARRKSVALWEDEYGREHTNTNFLLGNHPDVVNKLYSRVFQSKKQISIVPTIITPLLLN